MLHMHVLCGVLYVFDEYFSCSTDCTVSAKRLVCIAAHVSGDEWSSVLLSADTDSATQYVQTTRRSVYINDIVFSVCHFHYLVRRASLSVP